MAHGTILLAASLIAPMTSAGANGIALPEDGELIVDESLYGSFEQDEMPAGTIERVEVDGPGFEEGFRITTRRHGYDWESEAFLQLDQSFSEGEVLLLNVKVRRIESNDESTQALGHLAVAMIQPPWSIPLSRRIAVGGDWEEFWIPGRCERDFPKGSLNVKLMFGDVPQIVEIGGIRLWRFPAGTDLDDLPRTIPRYAGMEADAPWRGEAMDRIRELRTAPLELRIVDREGNPVEDASIRVDMQRHAFPFGSAVSAFQLAGPDPELNARTRSQFLSLLNSGTFFNDLKWPAWVGEWGETFDPAWTLAALRWFQENRLHFRGHVLVWPGWHNLPAFMEPAAEGPRAAERLQLLILSHIDEITMATAGLVDEWDVVNEPRSNHDIMDIAGNAVMADWFKRAAVRAPEAGLALNDFGILSARNTETTLVPYEQTVDFLLSEGAPISVMGIQGHMGSSFTPPERLKTILDRLAQKGLPIRITEFTLRTDFDDIAEQYSRDFLTLLFSHPAVIGVQAWGTETLFRPDGSHTPTGRAWHSLIREEWWTRAEGRTSTDGSFRTPAFLGRYEIRVQTDASTKRILLEHRKGTEPVIITLDETMGSDQLKRLLARYLMPFLR